MAESEGADRGTDATDDYNFFDDEEMNAILLNFEVPETPPETNKVKCLHCGKVCVSQRGLKRHMTNQHSETSQTTEPAASTKPSSSKQKQQKPPAQQLSAPSELLPDTSFIKIVRGIFRRLAIDKCYPETTRKQFETQYDKITYISTRSLYDNVLNNVVKKFKGDTEKFYPNFIEHFETCVIYDFLDDTGNTLLMFELANGVLSYLANSEIVDDDITFEDKKINFDQKDREIIFNLSGVVVGNVFRKVCYSKRPRIKGRYDEQYLAFLKACKYQEGQETDVSHHRLVNLNNRGGLWKVNRSIFNVFMLAESYFVSATTDRKVTRINVEYIVSSLMANPFLLANFNSIRHKAETPVKKEIAMNLLDDLLTLYVRIRSHSFAKDKVQSHKMAKNVTKSKSLRGEIKRKSSSLDNGH
eukprot:TCONS_00036563-protein